MRTTLLIFSAILCFCTQVTAIAAPILPCDDSISYQSPHVYGGRVSKACAVTGLSPQVFTVPRKVMGYAKYGICDYEELIRRATKDAWEKCDRPVNGVTRVGDWQFVCLDHTYGSDLGSTATAEFACSQ